MQIDLTQTKIGDIVEFYSLCVCTGVIQEGLRGQITNPMWPADQTKEWLQFKTDYLVFERIAIPEQPTKFEKIFQTPRTKNPRGKHVDKKDLSLYTHWPFKTDKFFELLEEASDV